MNRSTNDFKFGIYVFIILYTGAQHVLWTWYLQGILNGHLKFSEDVKLKIRVEYKYT